jgi:biofilm PGA synthesis N-glycosyltransferase PgaC
MKPRRLSYVLVTPARNEERFIEGTLESVCAQSVLPDKWVVVSDGSTDGTDDIVQRYSQKHSWIEFVRRPPSTERHFAAKVQCFKAGYDKLGRVDYDIIGNLDADITFEKNYFEFLLGRFAEDERLGVAGTPFVEQGIRYDYRFTNVEHVSGACQLFRRECFEAIGGYRPVKGGGIDWIAVTTARMQGWRTRTFLDMVCYHHRPMGTAISSPLRALYRLGRKDYFLGGHPLWQICRAGFQMTRPPYVVGGLLLLAGFVSALVRGVEKPVSPELVAFHRREQMQRLKRAVLRLSS